MLVRLLIDGYNVLHQSQLLGRARGPKWLQLARERLIRHVAQLLGESQRSQTQIVFDAKRRGETPLADSVMERMHITYAVDHDEADDLIERIIRQHPQPKLLTVVSSDHRLQRAAQARRATAIDSDAWLEQLQRSFQDSIKPTEVTQDKPEATPDHVRRALKRLGYESKKLILEAASGPDAMVLGTDAPSPIAPTKPRSRNRRKSTAEERTRANQRFDGELPTGDHLPLDE